MSAKIGELLPAEDELARWVLVLTLARNDLALTRKQLQKALDDDGQTGLHWARLLAGHLYEIAQFLRRASSRPTIQAFTTDLPPQGLTAYKELLSPDFLKHTLQGDRNLVFHYPSTESSGPPRRTVSFRRPP